MDYEAKRESYAAKTDLCVKHRHLFNKEKYKRYGTLPHVKKKNYQNWLRWVKKNPERRRAIALASFHRHKGDPKNKEYRRNYKKPTKKPAVI